MKSHEFANIFPLMNNKEFTELKKDIKENGLLEPIVLHEGQILDGRNRFNACKAVGVNRAGTHQLRRRSQETIRCERSPVKMDLAGTPCIARYPRMSLNLDQPATDDIQRPAASMPDDKILAIRPGRVGSIHGDLAR